MAFVLGALSPRVSGVFAAAIALVVAPIGGTFELGRGAESPFSALVSCS